MIARISARLHAFLSDRDRLRETVAVFTGTVLLTSLVSTALVVAVRKVGWLEQGEMAAYDQLLRSRPDDAIDQRLLVVGIGETDIQSRQEYPIHDGTLAEVLQKLEANEPRAIGIDIARDIPQGEGRAALLQQLAESDRTIAACVLSSATEPGLPAPPGVPDERIAFADLVQDADGLIRRSLLLSTPAPSAAAIANPHLCNFTDPDNQLLSLSFVLSLVYLEAEGILPQPTDSGEIQLGSTVLKPLGQQAGGYHHTDMTDYQIMLNYRSPKAIRLVSLTQVLNGEVDPGWIQGKVVLIGYTSNVAKDSFLTPYSADAERDRLMPGVVIHAQSVSQLLNAVLEQRPLIWYWPAGAELLWILGWSVIGGSVAWVLRKPWQLLLAEGLVIGSVAGVCYLVFMQGGWLPLVPAVMALLLAGVGVLLFDRANESGYTQAIYEQVKDQVQTVLKPRVEGDPGKRQDVLEITEASYFEDLQQRAKAIREKRTRPSMPSPDTIPPS